MGITVYGVIRGRERTEMPNPHPQLLKPNRPRKIHSNGMTTPQCLREKLEASGMVIHLRLCQWMSAHHRFFNTTHTHTHVHIGIHVGGTRPRILKREISNTKSRADVHIHAWLVGVDLVEDNFPRHRTRHTRRNQHQNMILNCHPMTRQIHAFQM